MSWQQFRAILWLRWRLYVNRLSRMPTGLVVLEAAARVVSVCVSAAVLINAIPAGAHLLALAGPLAMLVVWDCMVVVCLLGQMQRTDALTLSHFLHLPVSPAGAFVLNYLSSVVTLGQIVLGLLMLGLIVGLATVRGATVLLCLPLLAAFFFMITAVSYQFFGWLAALWMNKNRRRVVFTLAIIAGVGGVQLLQVSLLRLAARPSPVVVVGQNRELEDVDSPAKFIALVKRLLVAFKEAATYRDAPEHVEPPNEDADSAPAADLKRAGAAERQQWWQIAYRTAWWVNVALPPGWLPFGIMAAADGSPWPALAATAVFSLTGFLSLRRSYRTTLRIYTGQFESGRTPNTAPRPGAKRGEPRFLLLEQRLPWMTEQAAVVTLASFRSLTRAPETRFLMVAPFVVLAFMAGAPIGMAFAPSEELRPLFAVSGLGMGIATTLVIALATALSFVGNQFGYDRDGFRLFILSGIRRRDILLGKNLAIAPFFIGPHLFLVAAFQFFKPMPLHLFILVLPQFALFYLVICLLVNPLSIFLPFPVRPGTLQAEESTMIRMIVHLAVVVAILGAAMPALVVFVVIVFRFASSLLSVIPICVTECAVVVVLYHFALNWEGELLQRREQEILEAITPKAE
jgi:ABC-2 type transport system permease protein